MKRILAVILAIALIVPTFLVVGKVKAADYPHDPRGEITDVGIVWPTCYQGEKQEIYVEFRNPTSTTYHYLVAVNILDPNGNTVYDSHTVGEDKDQYVSGGQTVFCGTWYYTLPHTAPVGTYHVVAGLKLYPWTELDYRGASWCPPEETFSVKPSHETIVGISGDPYDDGDGYADSMRVQVLARTNALEELDVEVYCDLKDPNGHVVDTDGSGMWTVPAGGQSWSYPFYMFVPYDSPVGKYTTDVYLYDATHRNDYPDSDPEDSDPNAISMDPLYPPGYGNDVKPDLIVLSVWTEPSTPTSGQPFYTSTSTALEQLTHIETPMIKTMPLSQRRREAQPHRPLTYLLLTTLHKPPDMLTHAHLFQQHTEP
jgi:hypothetical protein